MLPLVSLIVGLNSYAASPQAAALNALGSGQKKPPVVIRINRSGPYATVLTRGGQMESASVTAPILVGHFSFGWQPLELLNFRCRLEAHALGAQREALLMRGMPKPQDDRPCTQLKDNGSSADVAAVRKMMRGPLVPYVRVSQDWALGDRYGAGGGQALFRKRDGRWQMITHGGGAMGAATMREFGVTQTAWCALGIYDATCP